MPLKLYKLVYSSVIAAETPEQAQAICSRGGGRLESVADIHAFVLDIDGDPWATDGVRFVCLSRGPADALKEVPDGWLNGVHVDPLAAIIRALADAPACACPLGYVLPRGPGPWSAEREAVYTRRLTELPDAVVDYVLSSLSPFPLGRVSVGGKVVGYAAMQRDPQAQDPDLSHILGPGSSE